MKRKEQLFNWLADRQRKYADGMALFRLLANDSMKQRYGTFLERGEDGVTHPFDPRFTQLVNCLSKIAQNIRAGIVIAAAEEDLDVRQISETESERQAALKKRNDRIQQLDDLNDDLQTRIGYLEDGSEEHAEEIEELKKQVESNLEEINQLRKEVDALNAPGVKVVTEESLPKSLQKAYARIKEIAPLYACLHGELTSDTLTDEERKKVADGLCDLDDERRKLWRSIDQWAEGKASLDLSEKRPEYSDNAVVRGYEMARQIKRLKENIRNSQTAAEKAQADGRQNVYENAMKRIARYEAELKELEEEVRQDSEKVQ
jgi:predicted RNase H-like nuclease (RuvC/YqgF family)